jgi:DNA-repair protein complementing XP-A cells
VRNANGKRPPLSVVLAASGGSPTAASKKPPPAHGKLQRDSRLGKYFDYDLSKMVNSKGGFLVEDDKEADDDLKAKERERERQRAVQNLDPRTFVNFPGGASCGWLRPLLTNAALAIYLDASRNPKCHDCGSMDIDQMYRKVFRCLVCNKCKNEKVKKYSLLTKTECKEVSEGTHFPFARYKLMGGCPPSGLPLD